MWLVFCLFGFWEIGVFVWVCCLFDLVVYLLIIFLFVNCEEYFFKVFFKDFFIDKDIVFRWIIVDWCDKVFLVVLVFIFVVCWDNVLLDVFKLSFVYCCDSVCLVVVVMVCGGLFELFNFGGFDDVNCIEFNWEV